MFGLNMVIGMDRIYLMEKVVEGITPFLLPLEALYNGKPHTLIANYR